jgi:hypothetical protein
LAGITPTTRVSFNAWASSSVQSGTATLGLIEFLVIWYNGATYIGESVIATEPATGGAMSVKSVLPPAGTNSVTIRVKQHIPSWSSGAVVRMYIDAVAVTVP